MPTKKKEREPVETDPIDVEYEDLSAITDRLVDELTRSVSKPLAPRTTPPKQTVPTNTFRRRWKDRGHQNERFDAEQDALTDQVVGEASLTIANNQVSRKADHDIHQIMCNEGVDIAKVYYALDRIVRNLDHFNDAVQRIQAKDDWPEALKKVAISLLTEEIFPKKKGGSNGS